MPKQDDAVTVVRDDGKEFLIKRSMVAEHINRGNFKVKNKADEPTLQERKNAVGFNLKSAEPTATGTAAGQSVTIPEESAADGRKPIDAWSVAELKEEAIRLGVEFPKSIKRDALIELVTKRLQEIVETEMEDHEVTQEDLDNNPDLAAEGVKVGEIIQIPKVA